MRYLYTFFIHLYKLGFLVATPFHSKAKKRVYHLAHQSSKLEYSNKEVVLFFVASLGEYEQAKPIIKWTLDNTMYNVVVSFFSPSGYDYCELPSTRCSKVYTPFDTPRATQNFISKINPSKVIFVKNELWWNMILTTATNKIEAYLVSTTIRPDHYFIKYSLAFISKAMNSFKKISVVDEYSKASLEKLYRGEIIVSGDTKFDKVLENKALAKKEKSEQHCIIYGSAWSTDLDVIRKIIIYFPESTHIIYPHDLSDKNIALFKTQFANSKIVQDSNHQLGAGIFINISMGNLKLDYSLAHLAYIGGGFGVGIHNTVEASVFGIPVVVGSNIDKNIETKDLIKKGLVFHITEPKKTDRILEEINNIELESFAKTIDSYFYSNSSPTEIICKTIFADQNT